MTAAARRGGHRPNRRLLSRSRGSSSARPPRGPRSPALRARRFGAAAALLALGAIAWTAPAHAQTDNTAPTLSTATVSGKTVTLTLAKAADASNSVTLDYTAPATDPIQDLAGNAAARFTGKSVTNNTPPAIRCVQIVSDPGADGVYAIGDAIEVAVTFDAPVEVSGAPELEVDIGRAARAAAFDRAATGAGPAAAAAFAYTVAESDADADLTHDALAADAAHKVDGARPALERAAVDGAALTLTWSEPLADGLAVAPRAFEVRVDGHKRAVADGGVAIDGARLTLTLAAPVFAGETVTVGYAPPVSPAGGDPVRDAPGNAAAAFEAHPVRVTGAPPRAEPGVTLTPMDLDLDEGGSGTYTVVLDSEPSADATVTISVHAGTDVTASADTLTFTPANWSEAQTVTVSAAEDDDAIADAEVTLTHTVTSADAAYATLDPATVTVTVAENDADETAGAAPLAWQTRFGRVASDNVIAAIGNRLRGDAARAQPNHLTVGGRRLDALLAPPDASAAERAAERDGAPTLRAALMRSSFFHTFAGDAEASAAGRRWAMWGDVAGGRFGADDGGLSLDGEVATATVGFDGQGARWLGGVALSYSEGEGEYGGGTAGGTLTSTLAGLHPYFRYAFGERGSVWGVLGYSEGELRLASEGAETALETDLTTSMAAFGGRAALFGGSERFELALLSDVRLTHTATAAARGLAQGEGATGRVRVMVEGAGTMTLGNGAVLRPMFEAGLRYDDGDAETGGGFEVGAGLAYTAGRLTAAQRARSAGPRSRRLRGVGRERSLLYRGCADGRGLSASLGSACGATQSGVRSLWTRHGGRAGARRGGAGGGARALRLGLNFVSGPNAEFGLELGRRDGGGEAPQHAIELRRALRW